MPKVDLDALPVLRTTGYLPPYRDAVAGRSRRAVADDLQAFGANLVRLEPGAWSSQRHWHTAEDELVIMVSGEAVLIEDGGETLLRPGDIATFPRGVANGHHLVNRSNADVVFLAVGNDAPDSDECHYPDVDMFWSGATGYVPKSSVGR